MQRAAEWMTSKQAARIWGVSERTARRYFDRLGAPIKLITDETGKRRLRRVLPMGTPCPEVPPIGNPHFGDREYQRAMSARRWDGHLSKAQIKELRGQYDEAMIAKLVSDIEQRYPLGMPEPPQELPEDFDELAPPFDPDPEEGPELPPHLKYPDKVTRDRMARKEARERRRTEP